MALSNDFMRQSGLGGELEIIYLLLSDIVVKDQIRKEFKDIDMLAASIRELGLQNPLVVTKKDGEFVLNQGERRYRALALLVEQGFSEFDRVPCHVIDFDNDEHEFMRQFSENFSRSDLSALEYADAVVYYRDNFDEKTGWQIRFSERYGVSRSFVSRHLSLSKAPDVIKSLCRDGFVTSVQRLIKIASLDNYQDVVDLIKKGSSYHDAVNLVVDNSNVDSGLDVNDESSDLKDTDDDKPVNDKPVAKLSKKHVNSLIELFMKQNNIDDIESLIDYLNKG